VKVRQFALEHLPIPKSKMNYRAPTPLLRPARVRMRRMASVR
jgi:hypothetical protein